MKKTAVIALALVVIMGLSFAREASAYGGSGYYDPTTGMPNRLNCTSTYHDPSTGMPNRIEFGW